MIVTLIIVVLLFYFAFKSTKTGTLLILPFLLAYPYTLLNNTLPFGLNFIDLFVYFIFSLVVLERKFKVEINEVTIYAFVFIVLIFLSDIISTIVLQLSFDLSIIGKQLKSIIKLFHYVLLSIIFINYLKSTGDYKRVIYSFFIGMFLISIIGILQYYHYSIVDIFNNVDRAIDPRHIRATGTTKGPWEFGGVLAIAIIIMISLVLKVRKNKIINIGLLIVLFIALVMSRSRASWLMVAVGVFMYFLKSEKKIYFMSVTALLLFGLISVPSIWEIIQYRIMYTFGFGNNNLDTSSVGRIDEWQRIFELYNPLFFITGYGIKGSFLAFNITSAHNNYIAVLLNNGFIGILFFTYIFSELFKIIKKVITYEEDLYLKAVWEGVYVSFISLLIYSLTADTFYTFLIMVIVFLFTSVIYKRLMDLS